MTGTPDSDLIFINEVFEADAVTPAQLDLLLAMGWRHFGTRFFRYSLNLYRGEIVRVEPLRVRLSEFQVSRSQRRVLNRNHDLTVAFEPAAIDDETVELFHRHKQRFDHAVPESIYDFLSNEPASVPTDCLRITARDGKGRLLAVSFFDVGETSTSAIYGCFDPDETHRSLGIFTMLKVIEFTASKGMTFYYHGYSYDARSFYDYKKRFSGTEVFDWEGNWKKLATEDTESTEI
jgi:leucyl-tRNA---protein transferase